MGRILAHTPEFKRTPADSPALDGYDALGSFETGGELVFGQRLDLHDQPAAIVQVTPGRWHSYWTAYEEPADDPGVDDDAPPMRDFLLVHVSRLPTHNTQPAVTDWGIAGEIPRVTRGGNITLIDRASLNDEALIDEIYYLAGTQQYGGRALCVLADDWSGARAIQVSPVHGLPTMMKISIGDPGNI